MDARIQQIRSVIDALARVEKAGNDTQEVVYDRELAKIRTLDRDGILDVVKRAIGSDRRRKKYSPFVFAELHDTPGIEDVFSELLLGADTDGRSWIIQTIGLYKMRHLVGVLNEHFAHESDEFCRDRLLHSLAKLTDRSSLPIFESLMRKADPHDRWAILVAGRYFGAPEFCDYLTRVFEDSETSKSLKVMAAWGLGKLGNYDAYQYLVTMLDDPPTTTAATTATTHDPGESIRAAQAIADINDWNFEWDKNSVDIVKRRLAAQA